MIGETDPQHPSTHRTATLQRCNSGNNQVACGTVHIAKCPEAYRAAGKKSGSAADVFLLSCLILSPECARKLAGSTTVKGNGREPPGTVYSWTFQRSRPITTCAENNTKFYRVFRGSPASIFLVAKQRRSHQYVSKLKFREKQHQGFHLDVITTECDSLTGFRLEHHAKPIPGYKLSQLYRRLSNSRSSG